MSFSGLVLLVFLGLIVFGPKKLVKIGKQIGNTLAQLKRASNEFQAQLRNEIEGSKESASALQPFDNQAANASSLTSGLNAHLD